MADSYRNNLEVGKTMQVSAHFAHLTTAVPARTWSSSNTSAATVTPDATGGKCTITGVAPGNTTITLHSTGLADVTIEVNVVAVPVAHAMIVQTDMI